MLLLAVHPGGSRSSAVAAVHPRLRLRPAAASAPHQHHPPAAAADTAATLADFGSCVVDARSWSSFEAGHAAAPCVVRCVLKRVA